MGGNSKTDAVAPFMMLECGLEGAEQPAPALDSKDHTPKFAKELVPPLGGNVFPVARDAGKDGMETVSKVLGE